MNILGIFVKQPVAGRVKTRLAADWGPNKAAELYGAFIVDIVDQFRHSADNRMLCYAPNDPQAADFFRGVAGNDYQLWAQPESSLGDRIGCFLNEQIRSEADRVVVIGSDSPTLPRDYIDLAYTHLEAHDCTLGPATDGGYYLIGQQARFRPIFQQIDWSSSQVLEQTVRHIADIGASLALLPPWYDVDTVEDVHMLRGHLTAMRHTDPSAAIGKTERLLDLYTVDDSAPL